MATGAGMTGADTRPCSLLIRPAAAADMAAIQAIYAHHVLHGLASFEEVPPDLAELSRRRADIVGLGLPYLVAEQSGAVRGYAYAGPYRPRPAYRFTVEDSVYVAHDAVGQGVGRGLLRQVIDHCAALGMRQMLAVIGDSGNSASIRLHASLGFRPAGQLQSVGFKLGRWVDSVIMQLALGEGETTLPGR